MASVSHIELTGRPFNPWLLLATAIVVTFVAEAVIMAVLPAVLPESCSIACVAIADACLLTLVTLPTFWSLGIRPLQKMIHSRMDYLRRALASQETERQRITQELHDGIGQSLTSLMLGLRALEDTSSDLPTRERAEALRKTGRTIHEELRRIIHGLRPLVLDELGLVPAIARLIDDAQGVCDASIKLVSGLPDEARLSSEPESAIFRIVQEALSNAIKHASASKIEIRFSREGHGLKVEVEDDGCGFDLASIAFDKQGNQSYGLQGMRERAMLIDGKLSIISSPNAGTVVSLRLPLKTE